MLLKNFYLKVIIRVTLIVLTSVVLGIVLPHLDRGYYYTLTGVIFFIALQAYLLINQANRTNEDLAKFFSSVQDHDSAIRFSTSANSKSFKMLHDKMNHLYEVIQSVKIENERKGYFLQNLVDHVDIGLLSFNNDGKIEIYNHAVRRYLRINKAVEITSLKNENYEIFGILNTIRPGQEVLHKAVIDSLSNSVLIKATEFMFDNKTIKLISFQDITSELDKKELDSWQKLIRVLTHEIMNSVSPITSLTRVISGYFKNKNDGSTIAAEKIDRQIIDKTLFGLNTIEETGKGLLDFVDKYRSLTSLPKPEPDRFPIKDLFTRCILLMETSIATNIKIISSTHPDDISIFADYSQVEQVIINLIKNAVAAISDKKNGIIELKAFKAEGATIIRVDDNGAGISRQVIEDIFVPFFTTRKDGSGIGLSLSRQIMQNHKGSISVDSAPGRGSKFTLKFYI